MTAVAVGRFYGWTVVAATFVLAVFGWGLGFYGPPVYFQAVREAHGWSVGLISAAVTVHFLVGAVVIAQLPWSYRRYGVPATTKLGSLLLMSGLVLWAVAAEPWQLFLATVMSGAGWVTMGAAAVNAIIQPWFVRRRPAALATAYNGASIGGVVFSPLWVAAIESLGFARAALLIGAAMVLTIWILADRVFAKTPEALGLAPDGDPMPLAVPPTAHPARAAGPKRLWCNRCFLTLAAGMALGLFAQIGLIAHLFSLLVPALGSERAGLLMGGATAAAIGGRTLVGWLMPAGADRRLVMAASYGVQIVGSLALIAAGGSDMILLVLGTLLFGAGIGNATSLPPLIAQAEFTKDEAGRVVPLIVASAQAAYAFAPASFGLIRELAPAETAVFIAAALIQAAAVLVFLAGRAAQFAVKTSRSSSGR